MPSNADGGARLLCDAMLGRLARWLRAAGHDVAFASGRETDRDLLKAALAQNRLLITRDQGFSARNAAQGHAVILGSEDITAQAHELKTRIGLDWLHAPFTRCVVDNTPLRLASARETMVLPARVNLRGGAIMACPTCGRLYWAGDHHRRMRRRLVAWQTRMV